jgi:ribosomal protein S18 acetylase RimI-like enzyme
MDTRTLLDQFDRQMRRDVRPDDDGARVERVGDVVRHVGPPDGWCAVLWSDLDEAGADAAIEEQVRFFGAAGRDLEWKTYGHDRPADLPARLTAAGFTAEEPETLLVAETAGLPLDVPPPDGVRLISVTEEPQVALVEQVHRAAFEHDRGVIGPMLRSRLARHPGQAVAVLALAGDEPVSAARLELNEGTDFAGLWGGGTVPAWRGRGIYRSLVAHRARVAAAAGFRYLYLDASEYSRPILERQGFVALGTTTPYVLDARDNPHRRIS